MVLKTENAYLRPQSTRCLCVNGNKTFKGMSLVESVLNTIMAEFELVYLMEKLTELLKNEKKTKIHSRCNHFQLLPSQRTFMFEMKN